MKPNNNKNRYGRFNGYNGKNRHNTNQINKNTVFDSTGPCGRIRGTSVQLSERYLQAAKDALSEDDRVLAENCAQYAEHYTRLYQVAVSLEQERHQAYQAQQQASTQTREKEERDSSDTSEPRESNDSDDSFAVPAFLKSAPPTFTEKSDDQEEETEPAEQKPAPKRRPRKIPIKKQEEQTTMAVDLVPPADETSLPEEAVA